MGPSAPPAAARFLLLAIGPEADKHPPPDVLAVAGTLVLAFRKAWTIGDYSFLDDRKAARKGEKPSSRWNRAGAVGLADDLDPVRDCRRPR